MKFTKTIPDLKTYQKHDVEGKLTKEQLKDGWFFCCSEWDGMLVHASWDEAQFCIDCPWPNPKYNG